MSENKTIGLDARLLGRRHAGLGRYIKQLALRLPLVVPAHWQLVYFLADKTQWSELIADLSTLDTMGANAATTLGRVKTVITPIRHYSLAEQTQLPAVFAAEKLDLLHVPHFNAPLSYRSSRLVVTIHDLLWHENKGLSVTTLSPPAYLIKYAGYRLLTRGVVHRASRILTPSQVVKNTVAHYYPQATNKIQVIYNGGSDVTQVAAQPVGIKGVGEYLLYVGSLYPHKNVDLLLQLLAADKNQQLVIVSARDAFAKRLAKQIADLHLGEQITILSNISDGQLRYLYQNALALIQPSFSEGFGMTGIEAMLAGTPVLASDIPVFHEIYGPHYLSFNHHDVKSLAAALAKLRQLDRQAWTRAAHTWAERYSWDTLTREVVQVYQEILQ